MSGERKFFQLGDRVIINSDPAKVDAPPSMLGKIGTIANLDNLFSSHPLHVVMFDEEVDGCEPIIEIGNRMGFYFFEEEMEIIEEQFECSIEPFSDGDLCALFG